MPAFGTTMGAFMASAFSGVQYHALRRMDFNQYPGAVKVKYRCGFEDDKLPAAVAALISAQASLDILSMLGPLLFPYNSVSVSIDGTSQSSSNAGPLYFKNRIDDLRKRRDEFAEAVKTQYQRRFLVDFV